MNKYFNNGLIAGYAFAKGVIVKTLKLTKSFLSKILTGKGELTPSNDTDFEIIDNVLYLMVGEYWGSDGGQDICLFDLEKNCMKIEPSETIYEGDGYTTPSDVSNCCVFNNELYYISQSPELAYSLNSCIYNKETGVFSIKTIQELDNIGMLLVIEDSIFICYIAGDIFYMENALTGETITVSGFYKESTDNYYGLDSVFYVNGIIYFSLGEKYLNGRVYNHVYYFTYDSTKTEFSPSLLVSFDSYYANGGITEGEYTNCVFIQCDYVNNNPIAIVTLTTATSSSYYTKIYDLTNKEWYVENGENLQNTSASHVNIASYNNELYLLDYNTGLHKISFDLLPKN